MNVTRFRTGAQTALDAAQTVGSIVARDHRTAAVFSAHGIDFCCKGARSLGEACAARGIDPEGVVEELQQVMMHHADDAEDFQAWGASRLMEHIEGVHHRYVEARSVTLIEFLAKLCKVHGDRHAELLAVRAEFMACAEALAAHMKKEELILFPFIQQLERAAKYGTDLPRPHLGTVDNSIAMMEHEHDEEGERFCRIAALTHAYTTPADGCTTYRTTYAMLREFEEDLHRHIHLENNILFPKAKALEQVLRANR